MPRFPRNWTLIDFPLRFEEWVEREQPPSSLITYVGLWVFTRSDDPFKHAKREPGFDNLWFAPIPGAHTDDGAQVTCSYWIEALDRFVRCNSFASLNPPFT